MSICFKVNNFVNNNTDVVNNNFVNNHSTNVVNSNCNTNVVNDKYNADVVNNNNFVNNSGIYLNLCFVFLCRKG